VSLYHSDQLVAEYEDNGEWKFRAVDLDDDDDRPALKLV
jgi:hypothetical protein